MKKITLLKFLAMFAFTVKAQFNLKDSEANYHQTVVTKVIL